MYQREVCIIFKRAHQRPEPCLPPQGNGCDIFEQSGRNSNRMRSSMSVSGTKASPQWNTIIKTTLYQPTFPHVKRTHCDLCRKIIYQGIWGRWRSAKSCHVIASMKPMLLPLEDQTGQFTLGPVEVLLAPVPTPQGCLHHQLC